MAVSLTGARTWVPRFRCHGTVVSQRHGGHELGVRLDPPLRITVWLKREEIETEGREVEASGSKPSEPGLPGEAGLGAVGPNSNKSARSLECAPPRSPTDRRSAAPTTSAVSSEPGSPPRHAAAPLLGANGGESTAVAGRTETGAVAPPPASPRSPGLVAAQERLDRLGPAERAAWRRRVGRNVVEALKFGIVPRFAVEALSVGLDRERRLFEQDLERARTSGAVRVLSAPYGSGKSHALDLIEQMALREGFLVARADLDAFECKPDHPRHVYRSLIASLRLPGDSRRRGIAPLLDAGCEEKAVLSCLARRRSTSWHEFLGPALVNWKALAGDEAARDHLHQWIAGEDVDLESLRLQCAAATARTHLLSLGGYTTLSSHFCYQLGGISELARLLGYSGLVVLLDEAEHMRLLSTRLSGLARDLFRGLVHNALGPELPAAYLKDCYLGGRKKFPFHWRLPAHFYLVVACTPVPTAERHLDWIPSAQYVTDLPRSLTEQELDGLTQRVTTVYGWAREGAPGGNGTASDPIPEARNDLLAPGPAGPPGPSRLEPETRRRLARLFVQALDGGSLGNIRQVVQTLVEALDRLQGLPGWSWPRVVEELEGFVEGGGGLPERAGRVLDPI